MAIGRTNCGAGGSIGGLPQFTYTGDYTLLDDGDKNWRIKLLTSGTLTFTKAPGFVDLFLVGAGGTTGSDDNSSKTSYSGAGSGYTITRTAELFKESYEISIGASPTTVGDGGDTSITGTGVNFTAPGGKKGTLAGPGGDGASGGGAAQKSGSKNGASGGSDGSDGGATANLGGKGQGTTTREFGELSGDLYSPGGGAGRGYSSSWGTAGSPGEGLTGSNSGAGGTADPSDADKRIGGSGIVIIRNHREAA